MATTPLSKYDATRSPVGHPDISIYPIGDPRPMASLEHDRALLLLKQLLIGLFAPISLVAGELMILRDPLNLRDHLMPDVMVVLNAGEHDPVYGVLRRQYRLWDERRSPDLIIEAASPSTVKRDNVGKKEDYAAMGVREYVQFDPLGTLLTTRLQVFELQGQRFVAVPADREGAVHSTVLTDFDWLMLGDFLRVRDHVTERLVPTAEEALAAQTAALAASESEIQRLRAENARLRAGTPPMAQGQDET